MPATSVRTAALAILTLVACRSREEVAVDRTPVEPPLPAPRLGALASGAAVVATYGPHGGMFAIAYAWSLSRLGPDGTALVCDEQRLRRLDANGQPDPTFGDRGVVRLPELCRGVVRGTGPSAFVMVGPASPLAPLTLMQVSATGALTALGPARELWCGRIVLVDDELLELRATNDGTVVLETLSPRPASIRLDITPEEIAFDFTVDRHRRPLVWRSSFFASETVHRRLVRFLPSGARDASFGDGGVAQPPQACGAIAGVLALADDRLVVTTKTGCVAILDERGRLDKKFGTNGIVELGAGASAPLLVPDGRIVLTVHGGRTSRLVTLRLADRAPAITDVPVFEGPIQGSSLAGVDQRGRVLVDTGLHKYVTDTTTEQETALVMTQP